MKKLKNLIINKIIINNHKINIINNNFHNQKKLKINLLNYNNNKLICKIVC